MTVLLALWFVVLYDPQWLVVAFGVPSVVLRISTILFGLLLLMLVVGVAINPAWQRQWTWYPPLACIMLVGAAAYPFALNRGFVRESLQVLLLEWALIVGTITLITTARLAERVLLAAAVAFLWWACWGARSGLVYWHPILSNYDGYGAYMVIGIGLCSFLAQATRNPRLRKLMIGTVMLCIVGVVASFARGAFLAALAVFGTVWLRSQRKGATLAAGLVGIVVMISAAEILHPGTFWNEIRSAFNEGNAEGTGEDRWILWMAAVRVFLQEPLVGAGLRNVGIYASQFFEFGDLGGMYENPARLYGRSLHSMYFTILAEQGILGCAAFAWLIIDFWKRNRALQKPVADQRWMELGGTLRITLVARGLEVAMVGFLAGAIVYAVDGFQVHYTLLATNLLLHSVVYRGRPPTVRMTTGPRNPTFRGQSTLVPAQPSAPNAIQHGSS